MFETEPELSEMLGDVAPATEQPFDFARFFETLEVGPTTLNDAFAKAHSPEGLCSLVKAANPANHLDAPKLSKAADFDVEDFFTGGSADLPSEDSLMLAKAKRGALSLLHTVDSFSKGEAAEHVTQASLATQLEQLYSRARSVLDAKDRSLVEKALRALDFSAAIQILTNALTQVAA
jgi:hypothetical protein